MAVNKSNSTIPVTLTPYHVRKLSMMCQRSGLTKTQVVQRLIENHEIVFADEQKLKEGE